MLTSRTNYDQAAVVSQVSPDLLLSREAGVFTITLNRPSRKNSVTSAGWVALGDAVRTIDPRLDRVVVITGAGGTFCAGADLAGNDDSRRDLDNMRTVGETCLAVHRIPVPTIAAVDGAAVGAGMNLALACDFVIATERTRFCEIFIKRALSVDFGGSWLLPRIVGMQKAKELVMLGEFVSATQALDLGMVREVVPPAGLAGAVAKLAAQLAAGPQMAQMQSKALLNDSFEITLERALDDEGRAQVINLVSEDAKEAFAAFLEKRPSNFVPSTPPSSADRQD